MEKVVEKSEKRPGAEQFKKTPEEKEAVKKAKSEWKKSQVILNGKGA